MAYSGEATYFQLQLNALGNQPGYDIVRILHDVGSAKIDVLSLKQYAEQGVQYAIVSSYASETNSKYKDFYESLREQATLIKEFRPSQKTTGPTLRIYQLRQPVRASDVKHLSSADKC